MRSWKPMARRSPARRLSAIASRHAGPYAAHSGSIPRRPSLSGSTASCRSSPDASARMSGFRDEGHVPGNADHRGRSFDDRRVNPSRVLRVRDEHPESCGGQVASSRHQVRSRPEVATHRGRPSLPPRDDPEFVLHRRSRIPSACPRTSLAPPPARIAPRIPPRCPFAALRAGSAASLISTAAPSSAPG